MESQTHPTPSAGWDSAKHHMNIEIRCAMNGICGPWFLWVMGRCFDNTGELASMRSMSSGKVCVMTFGEMMRASIGSREYQSRMTSDGRSCGYCCVMRGRRWESVSCASESMSTQP